MPFRFRLTLYHRRPGVFRFDTQSTTIECDAGMTLVLTARNANTLAQSTSLHFEAGGFPDAPTARQAGERLRLRLRLLNAKLGLGLNVPLVDATTGSISNEIKAKAAEDGATLMDTMKGLFVFPDD